MDHAFGKRKTLKSVHSVLENTQQNKVMKNRRKAVF